MTKKEKDDKCCSSDKDLACCRVESVVTVDERGQMVLPKEIRKKAKIHAGEKLALISSEKNGEVCCITLIKAQDLEKMVKSLLGPMMEDIIGR